MDRVRESRDCGFFLKKALLLVILALPRHPKLGRRLCSEPAARGCWVVKERKKEKERLSPFGLE